MLIKSKSAFNTSAQEHALIPMPFISLRVLFINIALPQVTCCTSHSHFLHSVFISPLRASYSIITFLADNFVYISKFYYHVILNPHSILQYLHYVHHTLLLLPLFIPTHHYLPLHHIYLHTTPSHLYHLYPTYHYFYCFYFSHSMLGIIFSYCTTSGCDAW